MGETGNQMQRYIYSGVHTMSVGLKEAHRRKNYGEMEEGSREKAQGTQEAREGSEVVFGRAEAVGQGNEVRKVRRGSQARHQPDSQGRNPPEGCQALEREEEAQLLQDDEVEDRNQRQGRFGGHCLQVDEERQVRALPDEESAGRHWRHDSWEAHHREVRRREGVDSSMRGAIPSFILFNVLATSISSDSKGV